MENKKKLYKLKKEDEDKSSLDEQHKKTLEEIRRLDKLNPMEQASKYKAIKDNPPKPGYMKVELFEEKGPNEEPVIVSKSGNDGKEKKFKHSPFFAVDLNTLIQANIAAVPSNVVPQLIDQAQRLAVEKKLTFKPEKRMKEFNYWWIVFILCIVAPIIPLIFIFL